MGKTKKRPADVEVKPPKSELDTQLKAKVRRSESLRSIKMPSKSATAAELTADQKNVVKKQCQQLYNYKHTEKRVTKIETATSQLEQMMQAKALQLKLMKKKHAIHSNSAAV